MQLKAGFSSFLCQLLLNSANKQHCQDLGLKHIYHNNKCVGISFSEILFEQDVSDYLYN